MRALACPGFQLRSLARPSASASSRSVVFCTRNDVMRITALNQIFGMLAASPNATLSVFGKDGSAKDTVAVLKNPSCARPAWTTPPIRPATEREATRDAGRPRPRRYDADQLTDRNVAPTIRRWREDSDGGQGELNESRKLKINKSEEEVRHVSRNSATDIVSLPWRGGSTRGAGPIGGADHRTGGARHRGRRLCLLLLHHVDGHVPQAIHQRHRPISRAR